MGVAGHPIIISSYSLLLMIAVSFLGLEKRVSVAYAILSLLALILVVVRDSNIPVKEPLAYTLSSISILTITLTWFYLKQHEPERRLIYTWFLLFSVVWLADSYSAGFIRLPEGLIWNLFLIANLIALFGYLTGFFDPTIKKVASFIGLLSLFFLLTYNTSGISEFMYGGIVEYAGLLFYIVVPSYLVFESKNLTLSHGISIEKKIVSIFLVFLSAILFVIGVVETFLYYPNIFVSFSGIVRKLLLISTLLAPVILSLYSSPRRNTIGLIFFFFSIYIITGLLEMDVTQRLLFPFVATSLLGGISSPSYRKIFFLIGLAGIIVLMLPLNVGKEDSKMIVPFSLDEPQIVSIRQDLNLTIISKRTKEATEKLFLPIEIQLHMKGTNIKLKKGIQWLPEISSYIPLNEKLINRLNVISLTVTPSSILSAGLEAYYKCVDYLGFRADYCLRFLSGEYLVYMVIYYNYMVIPIIPLIVTLASITFTELTIIVEGKLGVKTLRWKK